MDLEECKVDSCVFRRLVNGRVALMVRVHVDDIIVAGKKNTLNKFFEELRQRFSVKTEGNLACTLAVLFQEAGNQVSWR